MNTWYIGIPDFKFYYMKKVVFYLFLGILLSSYAYAQSAKQLHKEGKIFVKEGDYLEALTYFDKAIELDPSFSDPYISRAEIYEIQGDFEKAAEDYKKLSEIDPKNALHSFNAGRIYYKMERYPEAISMLNLTTELDKKNIEAYHLKINALIAYDNYRAALVESEKALEIKETATNYYYHGIVCMGLPGYLNKAEWSLRQAISKDKKFDPAYVALAKVLYDKGDLDEGLSISNQAIELNPKNKDAYFIRAKLYHKKSDYPNAINDLSKIIMLYPGNEDAYFLRGTYYQDFKLYQNAVNDFAKVIEINRKNHMAFYNRAISNEKIDALENAAKDYESFIMLAAEVEDIDNKLVEHSRSRVFELNRENEKPMIKLHIPELNEEDVIEIALNAKSLKLKGVVEDRSELTYFKINNQDFSFTEGGKNEFEVDLIVSNLDKIVIASSDIYQNENVTTYAIKRTEIDPPVIDILKPYTSQYGEIFVDSENDMLFIAGKIADESKIKSISIDGMPVKYVKEQENPEFNMVINIKDKVSISVRAEDLYGNVTTRKYTFNKEDAKILAENPMGKTWVVFIENAKYNEFASLEGPGKDVNTMKSALSKYQIHNSIHKKNLTKSELERFFSIELRDMVKINRVNSIIVWYAGHGKFINETGYWIPVDAKRDDEFTYFNINNLKAGMQSYSNMITHTLVITDACESGPSFYAAMRNDVKERVCGDYEATRFKSSQVFSSAGYELASDNSVFTKTFATALNYNTDECIAIDNIVIKVTDAVSNNNQQKPKFGKINGLEDENGTFFFIKK
jgi:tetratricopeptide (TPR) repeat protein